MNLIQGCCKMGDLKAFLDNLFRMIRMNSIALK